MLILMGLIVCACLPAVNCYCQSKTFYATENSQIIQHMYYGSRDDCVFSVQPSINKNKYFDYSKYIRQWQKQYGFNQYDYFLEISWISFDVKGNMPDCSNDYVEVFLSKGQKSIGRFCSNNLVGSKLFNMYSYDGYAKIKFHSDGSTNGKGFKLTVRLRKTSSNYLQSSDDSDWCNTEYFSASSDLYSPKWPHEYESDKKSPCKYKIDVLATKKIIFMDLNIRRYSQYSSFCNQYYDDSIQVKGTSSASVTFEQATVVKSPFCSSDKPISITTKYRYIYIRFTRQVDGSSDRGFVAGYVTYINESKVSTPTQLIAIASIAGSLCLVVILIGIICCCCYRRSKRKLVQNQQVSNQNPSQSAPAVTYSAFQPAVGYQGPYQSPQTYPSDMPPPYSPYDSSVSKQHGYQTGGQAPVANNLQYQSQPAYNPNYYPPRDEHSQTPNVNTHLLH